MKHEIVFNTIVAAALFALGTIASWSAITVPPGSRMTQEMVKAFGPSDRTIVRNLVDFLYDRN